jgi:hypothetical protein
MGLNEVQDYDHGTWHQSEVERREHEEWINGYDKGEKKVVDATRFASSESKDLKAKDFIGKNLRVCIESVSEIHFDASEGQPVQDRLRLSFKGKEKGLVLNPSNTQKLIGAYGPDTDKWVGHDIGLATADYTSKGFGHGWVVTPLDVDPPEFDDEITF